jgi:hypothetical protein
MDVYINPAPSHKNITPFLVETNREILSVTKEEYEPSPPWPLQLFQQLTNAPQLVEKNTQ